MTSIFCWSACAALLLLSGAAAAQPAVEITPFIGYRAGGEFKDDLGNNLRVNANTAAALALNWRSAEPGAQYELFYSRQASKTNGTAPISMKTEYLQIGGTTELSDGSGRLLPFAVGGLGAARFSPSLAGLNDETRWGLNLGGGVRVPLAKHVRLRFEARGYLTWLGGNSELFCSGGCAITAKSKTLFQYEALGGVSVSF